jgi:membrane protein
MARTSKKQSAEGTTSSAPTLAPLRALWLETLRGFSQHNSLTQSAALAFFFLMSMFPFLIFLASALALLPIQHLVDRTTDLVSNFVPDQSMPFVTSLINATMRTSKGLLSAGFIGAIIFASNGFAAMISALDTTYEVKETRSFWQVRLLAIWMTFVVGGLIGLALTVMLLGPRFGLLLADAFDVSNVFVAVWPYMRWAVIVACMLSSIELLYYWGPNARHTFKSQIPGAVFAVVLWAISSAMLGIYLRNFAYFNSTYGTLGVFIVLMLRFQLSALAILLGAELNSQRARREAAKMLRAARTADEAAAQEEKQEERLPQSTEA